MSEIKLDQFLKEGVMPFFKASEMKTNSIKVKITNLREENLQYSGRTLIVDFEYKKTTRSLPLNRTNLKKLIEKFGTDPKNIIGQEITLTKVLVTNPKTKQEVESIRIK